jgi:flavodoxin
MSFYFWLNVIILAFPLIFSKKKISLFITMGRNKTTKALSNFKKAIEPNKPIAELPITDNLKNVENVEEKIEYWCNELVK